MGLTCSQYELTNYSLSFSRCGNRRVHRTAFCTNKSNERTYRHLHTIFPQNFAMARFYSKAQFDVAIIRGQLDFEGSIHRISTHTHTCTTSIISLFVCTNNPCVHMYIATDPFTMRQDFKHGAYWDVLTEHAVTFRE